MTERREDRARIVRCGWARTDLSIRYHDTEWGIPVHCDRGLFEFLILEAGQAGLSWETILKKRDGYREAFARFDAAAVARFDRAKRLELLRNPGIVRNRLKIEAAVANAKALLRVQREFGSFDRFVWGLAGSAPQEPCRRELEEVPAQTEESMALSRELLQRGFRFVGPTICYAFMQAVGMVNDHVVDCFRHPEIAARNASGRGREEESCNTC